MLKVNFDDFKKLTDDEKWDLMMQVMLETDPWEHGCYPDCLEYEQPPKLPEKDWEKW